MRLATVGVGNAGSRVVNRIRAHEKASGRNLSNGNSLIINATTPSFATTEHVPEDHRLVIGEANWEIDRADIEGDPDVAAEVASEERKDIIRAFDLFEFHEVDGILVVASLAGGTGGGAGAAVIDQLQSITDVPVYAVGILPEEAEGERAALNAARSLPSFVENADNVVVLDNESWLHDDDSPVSDPDVAEQAADDGEEAETAADDEEADGDETDDDGQIPPEERYDELNEILAERLVTLFASGKFGGGQTPEQAMDPSDVIRTMDTGGISSIGYASVDLPRNGYADALVRALHRGYTGLSEYEFPRPSDRELSWLPEYDYSRLSETARSWYPDEAVSRLSERVTSLVPEYDLAGAVDQEDDEEGRTDAEKINWLVRRAARSKLTLPCDVESADRALIALSGPSESLSRKGFENGRYWLEREADIVDVVAGDRPHDGASKLTAVVLFSNVTGVPRIEAMQETALEHGRSQGTEGAKHGTASTR